MDFVAGDLVLDAAGAEQIFCAAHVALPHEQAAVVTARTEGWPVGSYLAAVIARDSKGDVSTISGEDRYVADYLYRESLSQLPESVRQFLRRTAVLDQLCAPLYDAVLGESGSYAQLRDLEATSLFLVPLDRRRGWYRYHALFRDGPGSGRRRALDRGRCLLDVETRRAVSRLGADWHSRRNDEAHTRRLIAQLEHLGHRVTISPAT